MNDEQVMHAMGIDDAYRVERVLARGAGGVTELVSIDGSGPFVRRRIPVKLARRGVWAELAECTCARLPRVQATYEMPDEFVVVCDYVPGETLEQLVAAKGAIDAALASRYVRELCEAVAELHAHRVIHRDISPANVVVAADGAHLIDLGIARFVVDGATKDTTQLGTWGFASPEQYGFAQTDARSDVYSLGRLLGYLLTGVRPDDDGYERLLADGSVVPEPLREVVLRACAFEPSTRYQSAAELAAALADATGPEGSAVYAGPIYDLAASYASGNNKADVDAAFEPERLDESGSVSAASSAPASASASAVPPAAAPEFATAPAPTSEPFFVRSRWRLAVIAACVTVASIVGLIWMGPWRLAGDATQPAATESGVSEGRAVPSSGSLDSSSSGSNSVVAGTSAADGSAAAASNAADILTPEIVESGWSLNSDGYVHFAFGLKNPNEDAAIDLEQVAVTGYAQDGSILFSQTATLSTIAPEETFWYAGIAGSGTGVPDRIEFVPAAPTGFHVRAVAEGATGAIFEVSSLTDNKNSGGATTFAGRVTTTANDGAYSYGSGQVMIAVVLRDESGAIVGGEQTFVTIAQPGETVTFETLPSKTPAYATYEVYAQVW